MQLGDDHPFRLLIHDRDQKFSHAFNEVFSLRGHRGDPDINPSPERERLCRTLRTDCLDRILILGRRHLEHVLCVYRRHYNEHCPHRALDLLPPEGPIPLKQPRATQLLRRRDLLGGLIHEYKAAA